MQRPAEFWHLPGPRRFLEDVRSRVYSGELLIVEDAIDPGSIHEAIAQTLRQSGVFDCLGPEPWTLDLAHAIAAAADLPIRPLPVLAAEGRLRGSILVLSADTLNQEIANELKAFALVRNMLARQADPPLTLVIVVRQVTVGEDPTGWQRMTTQGIADPMDALVFASLESADEPWLIKRVRTAIAVEVGAWDLNLVARLIRLNLEDIIRPDLCLHYWAAEFDPGSLPPSWHGRTTALWGDEYVTHPAWLAKNQPAGLRRRVWAGQLAGLLPWIDQFRLQVTEMFGASLQSVVTGERYRESAADLDWGPIVVGLKSDFRNVPASAVRMSEAMRVLRNELAHGRPVVWEQVKSALETSRRFQMDLLSRSPIGPPR